MGGSVRCGLLRRAVVHAQEGNEGLLPDVADRKAQGVSPEGRLHRRSESQGRRDPVHDDRGRLRPTVGDEAGVSPRLLRSLLIAIAAIVLGAFIAGAVALIAVTPG